MREPPYTRDILRLATAIPGLEPFANLADGVECRSPTCGSVIRVAIQTDEDHRVTGLRQAVEACAYGQASAAIMGSFANGRTAAEVRQLLTELADWLDGKGDVPQACPQLADLAPVTARKGRHGAVLLPFRALLAALERDR